MWYSSLIPRLSLSISQAHTRVADPGLYKGRVPLASFPGSLSPFVKLARERCMLSIETLREGEREPGQARSRA